MDGLFVLTQTIGLGVLAWTWFIVACFSSVIAVEKNRDGFAWFFAGLFFGFPAFIAIAAIPAFDEKEFGEEDEEEEKLTEMEQQVSRIADALDSQKAASDFQEWQLRNKELVKQLLIKKPSLKEKINIDKFKIIANGKQTYNYESLYNELLKHQ